jgi:peptide/nickel transport system ATP-binding protein
VFQDFRLLPQRTVSENVAFALHVIGAPGREVRRRTRAALEVVNLAAKADAYPHEISGGELQRVNLARALLARPRYLVADEITASLDAVTQVRVWDLLLERCRSAGIGVLAISHDRALLETVARRVIDLPGDT